MSVKEKKALMVIDGTDKTKWSCVLEKFPEKDIYFSYEYIRSTLLVDEGEPLLFFFENLDGKVAYPIIKRKIASDNQMDLYDCTTPYGYGGMLVSVEGDEKKLLQQFRVFFNKYCHDHNIVSEFIRFYPLLKNHKNLNDELEIVEIGKTVEIKLQEHDHLLSQMPGKTRNQIRKAIKNGVEVRELDKDQHLEDFISIYYSTMNRKSATDYYFFSPDYFRETSSLLNSNLHLFGAFLGDKMIAATLILTSGKFMHYHLSGSLKEYQSLYVNNLLLYTVALWGQERGIASFHLGGGYASKEDSLYKFKKNLTNSQPLKYHIGKKIHNHSLYDLLVKEKGIKEDSGFFPLYRQKK